jgi:hypothetical protein
MALPFFSAGTRALKLRVLSNAIRDPGFHETPKSAYDGGRMNKPLPALDVPGNTEAERMDNALRKFFSVSKEDFLREEAKRKKSRARKKRAKKAA